MTDAEKLKWRVKNRTGLAPGRPFGYYFRASVLIGLVSGAVLTLMSSQYRQSPLDGAVFFVTILVGWSFAGSLMLWFLLSRRSRE